MKFTYFQQGTGN